MSVFDAIAAQQTGKEDTAVWAVGEQLKDICRREPDSAALIEQDIEQDSMGLIAAEKKINAYANEKQKKSKGRSVCVTPREAEKVLRAFYGLPGAAEDGNGEGNEILRSAQNDRWGSAQNDKRGQNIIDLADFM